MTVTTTTAWISYNSDGVTVNYTVPFEFIGATTLRVYFISSAGVITVQALNVDYTVAQAMDETGTITFAVAPQAAGRVVIFRQNTYVQATPSTGKEYFSAAEVESMVDLMTLLIQENRSDVNRSLTIGPTDVDGAGQYDAQDNRIENLEDPVNAQDAVTKSWAQTDVSSQIAAAAASAASAAASAASAAISAAAAQSATGGTYVLRNIGGTAASITADTGSNLMSLSEHQMFKLKPAVNSVGGGTVIEIDGEGPFPLRGPNGQEIDQDDIDSALYYDLIAVNDPVDEIRITNGWA